MQQKVGKILFVVPSLSNGGAERVVSVLASSLAEKGLDVYCIVYYQARNEYDHSEKIKKIYLAKNGEASYKELNLWNKIKLLRKMITQISPSYIIPFLPQVGFHVFLATIGKKNKIIQTVRNNPRTDPETRIERIIRNFVIAISWRCFVQNKEQLLYFPKFLHRKMVIIPNPVANEYFEVNHKYSDGIKKIVSMGRLSEQKNFDLIIRAASTIQKIHPDIIFNIYGEGNLKQHLQDNIDKLGLTNTVILCGRTNEPSKVLNSADVFILSSNYEGMPNALLEAMAIGIPCISTDCPTGPSDIITNDVNGLLIPVNDDVGLVNAINKYISYGSSISYIGQNAKEYIKSSFSSKVISEMFLEKALLINELM